MKKRIISLLVMLVICLISQISPAYEQQIKSISEELSKNIEKAGKSRVAVVDFTDLRGNVTELGRFIAEEFSVALLISKGKFEVVDRTHLQSILKENKLSTTGVIDPDTARKLGKIAGVDALITGTITPFGENIRLSAKILDAETAKLIGASTGNIAATEAIKTLLESGIESDNSPRGEKISPVIKPTSTQTVESKNFTFNLEECKRSGESLICYFLIKNNDQDRKLAIWPKDTRFIDSLGNEYRGQIAQICNERGTSSQSCVLPSGVPIKANLSFDGIMKETNMMVLFELVCWNNDSFMVKFNEIPITE